MVPAAGRLPIYIASLEIEPDHTPDKLAATAPHCTTPWYPRLTGLDWTAYIDWTYSGRTPSKTKLLPKSAVARAISWGLYLSGYLVWGGGIGRCRVTMASSPRVPSRGQCLAWRANCKKDNAIPIINPASHGRRHRSWTWPYRSQAMLRF